MKTLFAGASVLASLLSACGAAPRHGGASTLTAAPTPLPSGTYARQLRIVSESSFLVMTSQNVLERLQLVKITSNGQVVTGTAVTCAVNSLSTGPDKLSMPAAFVKALPVDTFTYTLAPRGNAWQLTGNKRTDVIGAKLAHLETDPMPQSDTDAQVLDQDHDGHPGMSVNADVNLFGNEIKGQVYIAARVTLAEAATFKDPARIDGSLTWSGQQTLLGASEAILAAAKPTTRSLSERSSFALRKLPDQANCQTVVSQRQQLFGPLRL